MNLIDIVLIIVIVLAVWAGFKRGFFIGFINLIVWIGSLFFGFVAYRSLGDFLQAAIPALGIWNMPIAFLLLIIFSRMLLSFIFNRFLQETPEEIHHTTVNKTFGTLPGFVNGVIYATIIAALLFALPISNTVSATTRDSKIASQLAFYGEWLDDKLSPIFGDVARQTMNKITVDPESSETVKLSFTVPNPRIREDLEAQMLVLVNAERAKVGLKPVVADPEMTLVARAHSRDMFARGYFSHYTPENKDPFDRMKQAGVRFITAGENLALGQTLKISHTGLMNSPGHKANILHKSFGRLGIGILDGGRRGLMITQKFRN